MKRVTCLVLAVSVVALMVMAVQPMAAGPPPAVVARVSGGGVGDFQDTPNAVNTTGSTDFSIGATVYADGSASGHFVCMIPAIVTISGQFTNGTRNSDGSVSANGEAIVVDHLFGLFFDVPFSVTLREGGPGVGGFDYRDESGFFGPGQFDTELVRKGNIRITP